MHRYAAVVGVRPVTEINGSWYTFVSGLGRGREKETGADRSRGQDRLRLAVNAYGYGHFPITAGIVLTALGIEGVIAHAGSSETLGGFYGTVLCGAVAVYLAGLAVFSRLTVGVWGPFRLTALVLLLAVIPAAVALPPIAALAGVVLVMAAVIALETWRYADLRQSVRS